MHGVFLDIASLNPQDLDLQPLLTTLDHWQSYDATTADECASRIQNATVVVTNKVELDDRLIKGAKKLKLICVAATGTNNIDTKYAAQNGIAVKNVRGYATASVTEHVFALLLSLTRQLDHYRAAVARWPDSEHFCVFDIPIQELAGKTLGIIGYGELGQAVARLAQALSMNILIAQRPGTTSAVDRLPLEELLPQVDVLSLHCPLNEDTRHLISRNELSLMKPDSILINTARGGIVNALDLLDALISGQIGAAAVDVLDKEPPGENHPLLNANLENLIVTPHVAWASQAARQRLINGITENIQTYLANDNQPVSNLTGC
jgi:glycerate dehydrogenase